LHQLRKILRRRLERHAQRPGFQHCHGIHFAADLEDQVTAPQHFFGGVRHRHAKFAEPLNVHFAIFSNTTPWDGTSALKLSEVFPRSTCFQRSRTLCEPLRPMSLHFAVTLAALSPRLNSPTAWPPSARGLAQTSRSPSLATRTPCLPSLS